MKNHLIISLIANEQQGIVSKLTRLILEAECNVGDSRMTRLGGAFAAIMLVDGDGNQLEKLEHQLKTLAQQEDYLLSTKQNTSSKQEGRNRLYQVKAITIDHPGILQELSAFFQRSNINIINLSSEHYLAAHTATPMFSLQMKIEIPSLHHIPLLKEKFFHLCDEMNLDSTFEAIK